jgi:hypothetical protein
MTKVARFVRFRDNSSSTPRLGGETLPAEAAYANRHLLQSPGVQPRVLIRISLFRAAP